MIHLENVSKTYPTATGEVRALDGVSLSVGGGEFVAVQGPSGCGKSTLLALVGGLAAPTSGTITVGDREISGLSSADRAAFRAETVGFVFQTYHLLPYLDVLDNVLAAAPRRRRATAPSEARRILERFQLMDRLKHRPSELSAGERQRVAMARALLNQPALILADEPTGNLDPEITAAVLDQLAEFHQEGGTILMVTHDEQAAGFARRMIRLCQGRIEDV